MVPAPDQPAPDQPVPDQPAPDRTDTGRASSNEAPAVPNPAHPDPDPDPETATPGEPAPPVSAILDGYFWERRRRRAAVPIAVGVLGLTAIGLVQEFPVRHTIEQDLTDESTQALREAGVQGVSVRFDGRDATLAGTVTSAADRDSALKAVRQVTGVRVAHDRLTGPGGGPHPGAATTGPSAPSTTAGAAPGATSGATSGTAPATVPPQVTVELRDGRLTLAGAVPSSTARAELVAAMREAVAQAWISSRISIDRRMSDDGLQELAAVLHAVGPDASVTILWRDGRLTLIGGVASNRQIRQAVAAGIALTQDPQRVVNRLTVDPRATVAAAVRALPPVTFRTAYSTPTDRDLVIIKRLAGVLAANPGVRLQVQGHTDDVGGARMNYGLSYARARTVYLQLRRLGIPRAQLSVRAFGEKDPKLPNTSPANRAANRRVEFVLTD